jgi:hypothetical protein
MDGDGMSRRVLKWNVPVDDQWHEIGSGPVVLVACQSSVDTVQVWTDEPDSENIKMRSVRVYGTGHEVPLFDEHLGSVITAMGALVWHAFAAVEPL